MAEDKSKIEHQEQLKTQEKSSSVSLEKFGGFAILETSVEGLQNLNPERKARKTIFLTESGKKEERDLLQQRIQLWLDVLGDSNDISQMVDSCKSRTDAIEKVLAKKHKKSIGYNKGFRIILSIGCFVL